MVISPEFLRPLRPGEEPAVAALLHAAFNGPAEAALVQRLRQTRAIAGEQVIEVEGAIVAYAALSGMRAPKRWLCLAPVAVHPDWQRRRLGKRMVGMIAEWARLSGQHVVVLGDVEFYEKCGFSAARAAALVSDYPIEQTLLAGPGQDRPKQALSYPAAFAG